MQQLKSQNLPESNTLTTPEQTPPDPDPFPFTIRRVYPLGKSLVLSLPPRWAAQHDLRRLRYCRVKIGPDGTLHVRALTQAPQEAP